MVGSSTALMDFLIFTLLLKIGKFSIPAANSSAVVSAALINFLLNRKWAFPSSMKAGRSLVLYFLLFAFNLIFSTYFIQWLSSAGVYDLAAKIISMALITAWNFILYRRVIFC